jgi:hypothetical protein
MVETGFQWERALRFAAAESAADAGFAEQEIAAAADTAPDIAPVAAALEMVRWARQPAVEAADPRKRRRIGPQPVQP